MGRRSSVKGALRWRSLFTKAGKRVGAMWQLGLEHVRANGDDDMVFLHSHSGRLWARAHRAANFRDSDLRAGRRFAAGVDWHDWRVVYRRDGRRARIPESSGADSTKIYPRSIQQRTWPPALSNRRSRSRAA